MKNQLNAAVTLGSLMVAPLVSLFACPPLAALLLVVLVVCGRGVIDTAVKADAGSKKV